MSCMGCDRMIKSYYEMYCLDCEYHVADIEANAYDIGYKEGLNTKFSTTIPIPNVYPFLHRFLIYNQDIPLRESSKRTHYIESFIDGFKDGFKIICTIHNTFQKVLYELVIETGKRLGLIYLLKWTKDKGTNKLLDYNLIRTIKKFIR